MMPAMKLPDPPPPARPALLLAHGAGAGQSHPWMQAVAEGLRARGIVVVTFDFPYMRAGRKLPDPAPVLERAFCEALSSAGAQTDPALIWFVGGKSMGGRIATQVVSKQLASPVPAGVVCFGYPLHPPGRPAVRRDSHLPALGTPLLLLHGTRDPFGSPSEMTALAETLPDTSLHFVESGDHSLQLRGPDSRKNAGLAGILDLTARWLHSRL